MSDYPPPATGRERLMTMLLFVAAMVPLALHAYWALVPVFVVIWLFAMRMGRRQDELKSQASDDLVRHAVGMTPAGRFEAFRRYGERFSSAESEVWLRDALESMPGGMEASTPDEPKPARRVTWKGLGDAAATVYGALMLAFGVVGFVVGGRPAAAVFCTVLGAFMLLGKVRDVRAKRREA